MIINYLLIVFIGWKKDIYLYIRYLIACKILLSSTNDFVAIQKWRGDQNLFK